MKKWYIVQSHSSFENKVVQLIKEEAEKAKISEKIEEISGKKYEDSKVPPPSHSSWYYTPFENYDEVTDVVLECKQKERALFKYLKDFS